MCGSFLCPHPLDNVGIMPRQRTVKIIEVRNWVKYHGEIMSMAEFCRKLNIEYDRLRARITHGYDLFAPLRQIPQDSSPQVDAKSGGKGYTLEELADLYSRFRDDEFVLNILADFSGMPHGSPAVVKLEREIQTYLENQRKEVHGK